MKILVPLKRSDQVKDLMPYVEKIARAGMKAVFLVPYPVDGVRWSNEESGIKAVIEGQQLVEYYNWENNLQKAKDRVSPAIEVLPSRGIEVVVDIYAGSLTAAIGDYTARGDVDLIVTAAGFGQRIAGLLNGSNSLFELFKRPSFLPALLIHPKAVS
ncbi:MAG: hypothetical protein ACREQV_23400 [Candidatus Binatia bacterium]